MKDKMSITFKSLFLATFFVLLFDDYRIFIPIYLSYGLLAYIFAIIDYGYKLRRFFIIPCLGMVILSEKFEKYIYE